MKMHRRRKSLRSNIKGDLAQQSDFFGVVMDDKKIELGVKFPYRLVIYFYDVLSEVRGRRITSRNEKMDLRLASDFLAVVKDELGVFPSEAFDIAMEMVFDLLHNESEFNLKYPISGMGILGQGKLRFVTETMFKRRKLRELDASSPELDEKIGQRFAEEFNDLIPDYLEEDV